MENLPSKEPQGNEAFPGPVLVEERHPFLEHLEDLRRRLLRSFLWVALGMLLPLRFSEKILAWLIQPVGQVVFLSPVEPFLVHLQVAFFGGIFLSFPFVAWEVWGFLKPALLPRERRAVLLLIPLSFALFLLGMLFCWVFLLPAGLRFLLQFSSETLVPMITVGHYVSFASWLILGCGLFFQMPMAILVLSRIGVVRPGQLLSQWRLATVMILLAAAILTPTPDVATQLLLAIPMGLLYLVSVGLSFLVVP